MKRTPGLLLAVPLVLFTTGCSSCGTSSSSPPRDEVDTPAPLGDPPPLAVPEAAVELVKERRAGVFGPIRMPVDSTTADPTLRGAIVEEDGKPHFQRHTAFAAVAVGDGSWVLVGALSGLWLLEAGNLALRARLADDVVGDVASSPDGATFAYGRCDEAKTVCSLEVRAFPSIATLASVPMRAPSRIRFADDGQRIVVSAIGAERAQIVELPSAKVTTVQEDSAVNDAIVLPGKTVVVYGTNDDELVVHDYAAGKDLYRTKPTSAFTGGTATRDQNAVAYDAARDLLLVGGNDDIVWRVDGLANGIPTFRDSIGFSNDVSDLAILPDGTTFVGLDSGSMEVVTDPRQARTMLGKSEALSSWGARIDARKSGVVTGALGGGVFLWSSQAKAALKSEAFSTPAIRWEGSEHEDVDAIYVGAPSYGSYSVTRPRPVVRVSLRPPDRLDVRATPLGDVVFESGDPVVATLPDGTRTIAAGGARGARRVYRIPLGGALSEPTEVPAGE